MNKNTHSNPKKEEFWLDLDNAAKIFPAVRSSEHTTVFRISAVLKQTIRISSLLKAVSELEKRFPYFRVSLRRGFFWYYLESAKQHFITEPDHSRLCRAFDKSERNSLLFRVLAHRDHISVEFSHILTDGAGAYYFLKLLLINYFRNLGIKVDNKEDDQADEPFRREESEDAYNRYFQREIPSAIKLTKAFHIPFTLKSKPRFDVLSAILPLHEIRQKAGEKKVSITEYLVAVYLYVLQEIYEDQPQHSFARKRKTLRIQVPVNLRKIYPSGTLRNFSLFILPEMDLQLGHYNFDEVIKLVYHKMQLETDRKLINKIISRNVGIERKIYVRSIPLFLKSMILHMKYYSEGVDQYSGVVTNLGKVELPAEISDYIDYFVFIPPPPNKKLKINCSVIGFNDKLALSFGNISNSRKLEQKFLRFLSGQGIGVKLIPNR
ncbi:MAG: hypothetical protein JXB19_09305 [Bacteroidales bacterium]|nr:hypothetical protein [Bacteroidales bacterium]